MIQFTNTECKFALETVLKSLPSTDEALMPMTFAAVRQVIAQLDSKQDQTPALVNRPASPESASEADADKLKE